MNTISKFSTTNHYSNYQVGKSKISIAKPIKQSDMDTVAFKSIKNLNTTNKNTFKIILGTILTGITAIGISIHKNR